jgi:hypothetical protein
LQREHAKAYAFAPPVAPDTGGWRPAIPAEVEAHLSADYESASATVLKALEDLVKVGLAEKSLVKYGNNTKTLLRRRDAQIVGQASASGPANLVNLG